MELPTSKTPATKQDPGFLLIYGSPKTGKTSTIAKLDNCLIVDTERGTQYVDAMKVYINSLNEYQALNQSLSKSDHQYDYIALDTVDNLAHWIEQYVCAQNQVATLGDMEFGKGFALVREAVIKAVQKLDSLSLIHI